MAEDNYEEPKIFDLEEGIRIEINICGGHGIYFDMDDKVAQQMVDIIQNKLNARDFVRKNI